MEGGENQVDPALKIKPGHLLFSRNYEPKKGGGYRRIDGYERYSGKPKPSEATIVALPFDAGTIEPSLGQIVGGRTSDARGVVSGVTVDTGSWAGNDATGYISITATSGTFVDNDVIVEAASAFSLGFDSGFE